MTIAARAHGLADYRLASLRRSLYPQAPSAIMTVSFKVGQAGATRVVCQVVASTS